jgi:Holliday junction resolvase
MANSNYRRGYQTEQRIVAEFSENGFYAMRSPSSKGKFDVIGIKEDGVYLIQAKRTKGKIYPSSYKKEIEKIEEWITTLPHIPDWLHIEFWIWVDHQGFTKIDLTRKGDSK